jgi:hypothetical protein
MEQTFLNQQQTSSLNAVQAETTAPSYINMEQLRQERIDQIKFVSPVRVYKKPNVPSKMLLSNKAREIQQKLSEQGKFVTWQEIIYETLELYPGCQHVGDLGLNQADNLDVINELLRLQRRVDTFMIAYESRVPLITIKDAEKLICTDQNFHMERMNPGASAYNRIEKFEDLFLGPLIKNQLVRRMFHIEDDITNIKQMKPISSSEVLKCLANYLRDNELWSAKVKQNDFETHLCSKQSVKSIKMLGIKITNIGMLIGSLKSVQHLYSDSLKSIRQSIDEDFRQVVENEKTWLFKQLNDKLTAYNQKFSETSISGYSVNADSPPMVQQYNSSLTYLKTDSTSIIQDLLGLYEKLFDRGDLNNVKPFLNALKNTPYLKGNFRNIRLFIIFR